MIEPSARVASLETTLHLWRMAAEVVATDADQRRRLAYADIIAMTRRHLLAATTVADLITAFGRNEIHGMAIRAALARHGKVLNADVLVAAACWQQFCSLVAERSGADDAEPGMHS